MANQNSLADFMYENMMLEMNVIHSAWNTRCKKIGISWFFVYLPEIGPSTNERKLFVDFRIGENK